MNGPQWVVSVWRVCVSCCFSAVVVGVPNKESIDMNYTCCFFHGQGASLFGVLVAFCPRPCFEHLSTGKATTRHKETTPQCSPCSDAPFPSVTHARVCHHQDRLHVLINAARHGHSSGDSTYKRPFPFWRTVHHRSLGQKIDENFASIMFVLDVCQSKIFSPSSGGIENVHTGFGIIAFSL